MWFSKIGVPEKVPAEHPSVTPLFCPTSYHNSSSLSHQQDIPGTHPDFSTMHSGCQTREIFNIWFKSKPPQSGQLPAFLFWHIFLLWANLMTGSGYLVLCWDALDSDMPESLDNKASRWVGHVEDSLLISRWQRHSPHLSPLTTLELGNGNDGDAREIDINIPI